MFIIRQKTRANLFYLNCHFYCLYITLYYNLQATVHRTDRPLNWGMYTLQLSWNGGALASNLITGLRLFSVLVFCICHGLQLLPSPAGMNTWREQRLILFSHSCICRVLLVTETHSFAFRSDPKRRLNSNLYEVQICFGSWTIISGSIEMTDCSRKVCVYQSTMVMLMNFEISYT